MLSISDENAFLMGYAGAGGSGLGIHSQKAKTWRDPFFFLPRVIQYRQRPEVVCSNSISSEKRIFSLRRC